MECGNERRKLREPGKERRENEREQGKKAAEHGACMRGLVNESSNGGHNNSLFILQCHGKHEYAQAHPSRKRSAMADLSRTDRLQPGRGCTSQTSQRLHDPERVTQRSLWREERAQRMHNRYLPLECSIKTSLKKISELSKRETGNGMLASDFAQDQTKQFNTGNIPRKIHSKLILCFM
jgi:hypothetical protein